MLRGLLRNYRKESILAPLFKMLEAIFELFVPLVIATMVDKGISGGDRDMVVKSALLLLALAVIGLTCAVKAQYYAAKAAIGAATALRSQVFKKLESFSFAQLEELGTDTMITRITADVNQVQNGINMTLRLLLRSPFIVFGAVIMAFTIDVKAAMVFTVTVPALAVVVYGIMLITMPLYKKAQGHLDEILSATRENLTGVRVIRAFGMEDEEVRAFNEKNEMLNHMQKHVGRIAALMNPVTFVIVNLSTFYLLYSGAVRVYDGAITKGQVIALVNYMSQILVELVKLANLIVLLSRSAACAARIEKVMNLDAHESELLSETGCVFEDDEPDNPGERTDAGYPGGFDGTGPDRRVGVEFRNVSFSYHGGDSCALEDISFSARLGEVIGIIGGTGSGKSTLAGLIPGFYFPTKGSVLVEGRDTGDYELEELRSLVGVALQKAVLFSGTIRENLLWGRPDAGDDELKKALETAQAAEFVFSRPGGLDEELHHGGRDLSGGQKQRLNIARAIVGRPPVVILDDSSSALDYATDAALRSALSDMQKEYSPIIFMISQRTASIRHADRIIVLNEGRMAGMGTHEELLVSCPEYLEIHESQNE